MKPRVLHVLSQRPGQTGSGVILATMIRHAKEAGYPQRVVVGVPAADQLEPIGGLDLDHIAPVKFERPPLDFPVPGMSDVMPYRSSVWSQMTADQLAAYRTAWRQHLSSVIEEFRPDLIHSHHIWLMSSTLRDLAPDIPLIIQCHGTGLRQLELCPHLADEVRSGCAKANAFQVLREDHREKLVEELGVAPTSVHVIPAGYREDLFHAQGRDKTSGRRLLYVGKYSAAKGLPELLDAVERLSDVEMHVAGSGSGPEADGLRARMEGMSGVTLHGQIDQPELAELMRRSDVCVLPSFYEGVPLVLVEAAAAGCRLVATALPGVIGAIAPHLGAALRTVEQPRMIGVDTPDPADRPAFVTGLTEALRAALDDPNRPDPEPLHHFGWGGVFEQVEKVWKGLL